MIKKKSTYTVLEGTANDKELLNYKHCFEQNNSRKNLEVLKWFHRENLRKENSILYALAPESNNIAAIYTCLPAIVKCMDSNIPALQSFDTLTDHRHRGKGLFTQLASTLIEIETAKGNELVFGFPNENSVGGFVKKLGFSYFGEVPFLIKPLKISYIIKKFTAKNKLSKEEDTNSQLLAPAEIILQNGASLKNIDLFGEDYDLFWNKIKVNIPVGVNRNAAYMNWRFVHKPGANYLRYGFYEGEEFKGVIVFTLKNKHGGKAGYLMELLFDPENKQAGKELLKFSSRILKENKADVILAWCFKHSFNYITFKQAGFFDFPEKMRPQKLGFIIKVLKSTFEKDILKIKNWYISYSDSDTV